MKTLHTPSIPLQWLRLVTATLAMTAVLAGCGGGGDHAAAAPEPQAGGSARKAQASLRPINGTVPIGPIVVSPPPLPLPPPPPPPPSFAQLMKQFTPFDLNADGRNEITALAPLFPNDLPYSTSPLGVIVVLVDPRLVDDRPGVNVSGLEMRLWLSLMNNDLFREGYFPVFITASVYDGPVHQDGRTLLALRRFLQSVRQHYPLVGVQLIGSFPDAGIVRSVFVKDNAPADRPLMLDSGAQPNAAYSGDYISLGAEYLTPRAEIVLGDLDGNWEALYRELPFVLPRIDAAPPLPSSSYPKANQTITTLSYSRRSSEKFTDVFYLQDHNVSISETGGRLKLAIGSLDEPNPEISAADSARPNRIARPEIFVSRLNPKSVAVMPTAPADLDGKLPLNAQGKPQALRYAAGQSVSWQYDGTLERRLLADYIARSHHFRLGYERGLPFRTSAIRAKDSHLKSPTDFNNLLRGASSGFVAPLAYDQATLVDYVAWLREPAVLRGIAAHSDAVNSQFGKVTSGQLEFMAAPFSRQLWRWVGRQDGSVYRLEPSFSGITVDANFHLYRTLWENGMLTNAGSMFVVHEGCEVMRFKNAESMPYNDPSYGRIDESGSVTNGESLLFYANGLGLMARNKVFNDTPRGFYDEVKATGRFGYGWRAYFNREADEAGLDERTADATLVYPGNERRWRTLWRDTPAAK